MRTLHSIPLLLAASAGVAIARPVWASEGGGFVNQLMDVLDADVPYPMPEGFDLDLSARRLVDLGEEGVRDVSEWEKIKLKAKGIPFMDITEAQELGALNAQRAFAPSPLPSKLSHQKTVHKLTQNLTTDEMLDDIKKFTSFRTRYYRSDTGRQSQQWLLSQISSIIKKHASPTLAKSISVKEFEHTWAQRSITVRVEPQAKVQKEGEITILGAHQDSTNLWPFLGAPGADDDGSGTVTLLHAFRTLLRAGFSPADGPVEFHWYSAEEGGLLGSQAVARAYEERGERVKGMIQFDMTAWVKEGTEEVVGVVRDFVDPELTDFVETLVDEYLDIPYAETKLGYAASDHASWTKAGYRSAFGIESKFEDSNKHIHSTSDMWDVSPEYSFEHMREFVKLAIGFAVELGGWGKRESA